MNDVCAGIICYNPEIDKLNTNIDAIREQVNDIYLIDNGSTNFQEWVKSIKHINNLHILENSNNIGVAAALNQLCSKAKNDGYKFCLTLDQDSVAPNNLVHALYECATEDVAVVAPNIVYANNEQFAVHKEGIEDVDWVITSASLMNLKIWEAISGFDDILFIDSVDRDYCIRARQRRYRIIKNNQVELLHELGNLKCIRFLGKTIHVTNHSAFRVYYQIRNGLYLDKKLGLHCSPIIIAKTLIKILLFEEDKHNKILAIGRGIFDGLKMQV